MSTQKIFCVIPAYNEEKDIVAVINSVKPFVDEIVIIDNNDRHKYFLRRGEIEKLEPGVSDRQFFVNMQTAFRQIYNYLGENPK